MTCNSLSPLASSKPIINLLPLFRDACELPVVIVAFERSETLESGQDTLDRMSLASLLDFLMLSQFIWNPVSLLYSAFMKLWKSVALLILISPETSKICAPSGFPASGNGLWYTKTGNVWSREWLPVGNGYLGGTSRVAFN